ncbi:MAG: ShlB/FhaC/HecB family hemolysin secretion/activation protein [Magnetococcales bacterium]|nr:ShlB/FhaC/HecB family hemolysin secretion/activation protein [Magnetococcales bacterium]
MMNDMLMRRRLKVAARGIGLVAVATPLVVAMATTVDRYTDGGLQEEIKRHADEAAKGAMHPAESRKTVIRAAMPSVSTSLTRLKLSIDEFRVEGVSEVSADAIEQVLAPWKKREINFLEFEKAVHAVAEYLRQHGHPNAEVKLSRAVVAKGKVMVAIQGLSVPASQLALKPVGEEVVPRIEVKAFQVSGVTVASLQEIDDLLRPMTNKALSMEEIKKASDSVADHLRAKGYPLVQAYLPPQKIDGGQVQIVVQEGVVDGGKGGKGVTVEGGGRIVKPSVMEEFLASGATPGQPLRLDDLERAVLLANEIPGIQSVKTTLEPGTEPGTTHVVAKVEESSLVTGTLWGDNYGSRYTGFARLNTQLNLNSPGGIGDQWSLNLSKSSGMESGKLAFQMPVGATGGKWGTSYSKLALDINPNIVPLNLNSDTDVFSVFGSYPVRRGSKENLWLSLNYDGKHIDNRFNGQDLNDRKINLLTLGAAGDLMDPFDGQVSWSASLGGGNLDLGGNVSYQETDAATARTEGGFGKLSWSVQRKAQWTESLSWLLSANGMLGSTNLDSAEKFQLGGPTGVRAYPVGEGLGDIGYLASTELRYSFGKSDWGEPQLFTFFDTGRIIQYRHLWDRALPASSPNNYTLSGVGVGAAIVTDAHGGLHLTWSKKVGHNPNPTSTGTDSDGTNQSARVWILGNILF